MRIMNQEVGIKNKYNAISRMIHDSCFIILVHDIATQQGTGEES
jgi:hypothetical protein